MFAYFGFTAGDFLAPVHTSEWSYMYSFRTLLTEGIPLQGVNALQEVLYHPSGTPLNWLLPIALVVFLIFPLLLFRIIWTKDRSLGLYVLVGYGGILCFGALASTPRYVSVLFPLWLASANSSVSKKSIVIASVIMCVFYIIALDLWMNFLNGQFIA